MITLKLTEQQMTQLAELVAAGGKSPATGANGIMAAAQCLQMLQEAVNAAKAEPAAPHLVKNEAAE